MFTVNQNGQLKDKQEGATASVTLTAREPGAVTNLSASDTKGTTTGSFDLPVVTVAGREAVNRFVTGYVVIQKEGSKPTTERDGEVIVSGEIDPQTSGKMVEFTKVGQKNGADLYITVFLKNVAGSYFWSNGQVVNLVPKIIPPRPTSWNEITKLYNTSEWVAPEDGWFKIIVAGRGGNGGRSACSSWGKTTALSLGAGGGSPGCAVSEIALQQGESIKVTSNGYDTSCVIRGTTMTATRGGNGATADTKAENGGYGGSASGGNRDNYSGVRGQKTGEQVHTTNNQKTTAYGRSGGQLNVDGYSFYGGIGGGGTSSPVQGNSNGVHVWSEEVPPSGGSSPVCIILRGNTNLSMAQQNAYDITDNSLEIAALAQEQTGLLLNLA